jgi:DNA mismatch endonuclease, patch repair protein
MHLPDSQRLPRKALFADTPDSRRATMSKVRSSRTSLEQRAEDLLTSLSVARPQRWALDLPGKPDFVWPAHRVALFVHSCFWHGCPKHLRAPKSRQEYWDSKIAGNRKRDRRVRRALRELGWRVVVLWEHDLRPDALPRTRRTIRRHLSTLLRDPCSAEMQS